MDDDWIEIDRIDVIGMIGGKLGQPDHQVGERFRVRRRQAAKRSENLRAFEAVEQRACGNDIDLPHGLARCELAAALAVKPDLPYGSSGHLSPREAGPSFSAKFPF